MKFFRYLKKAIVIISAVILFLLVVFNIYIMRCRIQGKPAMIGGKCILKITTGSMTPSLQTGDFILVQKCSAESLQVGDIISFYSEDREIYGKINTHRIVKKESEGFVTRGDANPENDSTIAKNEKVIGKYIGKIRFLKWLGSFTSSKKLLMLAVIIPTLAMSVYEVITIARIKIESDEEKEIAEKEAKQKLMREAIEEEKKRLYETNYKVSEVKNFESGNNNEKENVHSNND